MLQANSRSTNRRVHGFREALPDECPPTDATDIETVSVVYRLVRNMPPEDEDFKSQRARLPEKRFRNECIARGLSVLFTLDSAYELLSSVPHRGERISRVTLKKGAGFIKQTGRNPHHYTWWPCVTYDVLGACAEVCP